MTPFKNKVWLSSLIIDKDAMCKQVRGETEALYVHEKGKSCPTEILERNAEMNAEGRPIWKPMHMQPMYMSHSIGRARAAGPRLAEGLPSRRNPPAFRG